ncbi:G4 quadruplex nucleic acid binding protein [Malassezia vespertilionis]|uniref:Arc1p n=1 Tax=Malassezia vespertilionis TaxID=2020962 RepID=A0A2N1J8L8_9BASI|nr:G4 quadruplex nucleic acid binding protein [Malassezia vespertilionis]PKI82884.1 Arc1p [Malassezia vespertilionis]WFD08244.1 G4 quadruplex nucleic acid binding protein [Malassezia vespertilionis]
MSVQRSRQLLAEVYAQLVSDKAALKALAATNQPLRVYAHDLAALTQQPNEVLGATDADVKETDRWLDEVEGMNGSLEKLDKELSLRTFLSGNRVTAADYSLFASLYDVVSTLPPGAQHAHPSLARYFSHMSHLAAGAQLDPPVVPFEPAFEGFPKIARGAGKEKKSKGEGQPSETQPEAAAGKQKKAKADKGGKGGKGAAVPVPDAGPQPSMVDMRVGRIVDIGKHPDADALYLEKVDFGEPEGPRTILSGLVNFVPIDEMRDRMVVGICNLKPVAMRGIKSYGMLLCATSKDGKEGGIDPVSPPEGSVPGDVIFVDGYQGMQPLEQMNPKKKVFEAIQPDYMTTDTKQAAWYGPLPDAPDGDKAPLLLCTERGPCFSKKFAGATLS